VSATVAPGQQVGGLIAETGRTRDARRSGGGRRRVTTWLLSALSVLLFVIFVFPVYWMVNTSFQPNNEIRGSEIHFWPDNFTLRNYETVLFDPGRTPFLPAAANSLVVTILTVIVALVFAFLASIAVTRFRFKTRRLFIVTILVVQMIPAEGLFISQYQVLDGWHLVNRVLGLSIVYAAAILPFTVWMLRGFVSGVPVELEEAAMVDGLSRTRAFFRITFPLLAPGFVATGVFGFIYAWNEFTLALVVMTRPDHRTLPLWLTAFADTNRGTDWGAIMAGSTLIAIPVIIFFLVVQNRMTAGLTAGAVKG